MSNPNEEVDDYCGCSPKRREPKTDGESHWMCARCGKLINLEAKPKNLHPLIARWRKSHA